MNKKMKISMIIASALILVGAMTFAAVMTVYGWDFKELTTVEYSKETYVFEENVENISFTSDTVDITFLASSDGKCKVVTYLPETEDHTVTLTDGTLSIKRDGGFNWKMFAQINFRSPKITVYLPETEYSSLNIKTSTSDVKISNGFTFDTINIKVSTGHVKCYASAKNNLKIKASTGDVLVKDMLAGNVDIKTSTGNIELVGVVCGDIKTKVSTGDIDLVSVSCKSFTANGDTGDVELKNVIATEKFTIRVDTGDVEFDRSDAPEIYVKTDTGDVEGTLLTEKIFITKTDTGKVKVPASLTGGKCEIVTDTGDISIKIK